jgi:hypothetical protein
MLYRLKNADKGLRFYFVKVTLGQRRGLSTSDVQQMNLMYKCGQGRITGGQFLK